MLTAHILYIYEYQITIAHSWYYDPPQIQTIPQINPPDLQAEMEEEHAIV